MFMSNSDRIPSNTNYTSHPISHFRSELRPTYSNRPVTLSNTSVVLHVARYEL